MSVAVVGGAVIGVAGTAYASSKASSASRRAAQAAQLQPFSANTPFGQASIERGNLSVQGGIGSQLAPGFEQFAGDTLGQAQAAQGALPPGLSLDPNQQLAQLGQAGQAQADQFGQAGANFLGAGQQALGGVSSFNADQFAQDRLAQLNQLAAPGEANAANTLANQLFSSGRLGGGDTASGRAFGDLSQSLSRAETERAILSQQAATQELGNRIGQAGALSNFGGQTSIQGQDIAGQEQGRGLNALQGAGLAQGFNQQNVQGLLGLSTQGLAGIQDAFAPTRSAVQTLLAGSELQQSGTATAANAIQQGGTAQANLIGNATAGIVGGLTDFAASRRQRPTTP